MFSRLSVGQRKRTPRAVTPPRSFGRFFLSLSFLFQRRSRVQTNGKTSSMQKNRNFKTFEAAAVSLSLSLSLFFSLSSFSSLLFLVVIESCNVWKSILSSSSHFFIPKPSRERISRASFLLYELNEKIILFPKVIEGNNSFALALRRFEASSFR